MRYILILLIVLLGFSCRKDVLLPSKPAVYQEKFSQLSPSFTQVDFEFSYDTLQKWMKLQPGKTIFQTGSDASIVGFPLQVNMLNKAQIQGNNDRSIQVKVPISFTAEPSLAGFSAGKVNGQMDVSLQADVITKPVSSLSIQQIKYSYQWKEKPSLRVAGFGVNVSSVIDRLLASKQEQLINQVTTQINQTLQVSNLEKILNKAIHSIPVADFVLHPTLSQIALEKLVFGSTSVRGTVFANSSLVFTNVFDNRVLQKNSIKLISNVPSFVDSGAPFSVQLSWEYLRSLVESQMRIGTKQANLTLTLQTTDTRWIHCTILGYKGKASSFSFDFIPVLLEDNRLSIRLVSKELSGLRFPSTLFKKQVIRSLEKNLNRFNIDPMLFIDRSKWMNSGMIDSDMHIRLDSLQWNQEVLNVVGKIQGKWLIRK
ncbi:DUF4403 family protein [Aquirufa ecclesiirivi]|uniref:DUF4403 family protein n=1 Tax=Aquirufa ecclesiirivi TaxID=2715124 RepID=UPI00140C9461|nr:DUF4403 family protein [Aquirufa ecclesiirivi]NHC48583.1 DUF4403 family protein [Aquirufa ecclesiirivi]